MKTKILCSICLTVIAAIAPAARAQGVPAAETFAGYSFVSVDTNGSDRQSANGWQAGADANFYKYYAAEFEASGVYKTIAGVAAEEYGFAGGLRVTARPTPLFVHALFGGDSLQGQGYGLQASQNGFMAILGGGAEIPINRFFAVRGDADFVLTHHNLLGGPRVDQNNFHAGASVVFYFGGDAEGRSARSRQSPVSEGSSAFGASGYAEQGGLRVTFVRPGSLAQRAGLSIDDVILSIAGTRVRSAADIDSALNGSDREIKIDYLAKGMDPVETEITR